MSKNKIFDSIVEQLTDPKQNTADIIDRFIKFVVKLVNSAEEFQVELINKDIIYQMSITDIRFTFCLTVDNGKVIYKRGFNERATLQAEISLDQVIRMLKGELKAMDDYMKGKIKAYGTLDHGLLFIRIFRLFIEYLNATTEKNLKD
ncbi:MAG: hypothetical protein ACFFHV_17285 [Promethearchaeota archaeon]